MRRSRGFRVLVILLFGIFALSLVYPFLIRSRFKTVILANRLICRTFEELDQTNEQKYRGEGKRVGRSYGFHYTLQSGNFYLEADDRAVWGEQLPVVRINAQTSAIKYPAVRISVSDGAESDNAMLRLSEALTAENIAFETRRLDLTAWDSLKKARVPSLPAWIPAGINASYEYRFFFPILLGLVIAFRGLRVSAIPGSVVCRNCKYDLRGSPGDRCSECGQSITPQTTIPMTTPRRPILILIGVILIGVGFIIRNMLQPLFDVGA